jgi:hypothetical protein
MGENNVKNKVRPQNKHLIPLKKGQTANPNGRPLGQKNYATLYREALIKLGKLNDKEPDEIELEMIANGLASARKGDFRFYKDVLDRLHGDNATKGIVIINFDGTFTSSSPKANQS